MGSEDRSARSRKYNTGDPAPKLEVARVWRLGRRRSLFYCVLGSEGSCEGVKGDSSEKKRLYQRAARIHHASPASP